MALDEEKDEEVKEEASPEKKKLPMKLIVIALVGVLVLGGAAAGYFLVLAPKMKGGHGKPTAEKVEKKSGEKGGKGEGEGAAGQLKALEPFIVNLNDEQGSRYLKAVMQLEVSDPAVDQEITDKTPQIRDEILMLLSNKSYDDVATVSGKRILKREIIGSVNRFLKTGQVTQVYFSEFVVQ